MITLHLISHTHWDREWYLPFQIFRLKLVQLVDDLLDLMAADPDYRHFMLDGQTIILEDYLQLRPEREPELRDLIRQGRLLIGPWHILPDEFLVSPEALVRNLLEGDRIARRFGPKMQVGYIPDPFGHIGQMPQILRGFGITTASVQRGLSDEPCEFWWEAPDGSRVLMAYLRDGYGNAALLPTADPERFVEEVARLRDSLLPHAATSHLLLMHGTDHMPASPATSAAIAATKNALSGDCLVHSTLPDYFNAIQEEIRSRGLRLPVRAGELRNCQRSPLLPGVLSSRVWIKQRNHACETLLEKWAEPFSVFAEWATTAADGSAPARGVRRPETALRQAWRYLLENQPHDSICGCSIDQTHEEMQPRFDAAEQIAGEITHQSLEAIASRIDTRPLAALGEVLPSAVVVFNPTGGQRADWVCVDYPLPAEVSACEVVDETGRPHPAWVGERQKRDIASLVLDHQGLAHLLASVSGGKISGLPAGLPAGAAIQAITLHRSQTTLHIQVSLADTGAHRSGVLEQAQVDLQQILADPRLEQFVVHVSLHSAQLHLVAQDLPAYGYRTFWVRPSAKEAVKSSPMQGRQIENEFFVVYASSSDGSLTLLDKRTGAAFSGLNRLVDGGDCGDEYNYCPPKQDRLIPFRLVDLEAGGQPAGTQLTLCLEADLPVALTADRRRSAETVPMQVICRLSLLPGVPRLDFETEVTNAAADHRLRVHFPAPFAVQLARYDGHYEVVRRPVGVPEATARWAEQPRPEQPMRDFCEISQEGSGLMVAARGLREVEVLTDGSERSEIAVTLLRCVGWLSRDDFPARASQAGPSLPTPGAQMIGRWRFAYSIIPHTGDWLAAAQQARAFNAPLQATRIRLQAGPLPNQTSFVTVDAPAAAGQPFDLTAIKKAEDGQGWVVRGCNLTGDPLEVNLKPFGDFASAEQARMDEQPLEPLNIAPDGSLNLQVRGHEIVNLRLRPKG